MRAVPDRVTHHGHPTKYRSQRRSSTDAARPLILTSTSDVTAVVSGLISTVAIPAARANSTGAAMYSKRLLVPTLKTTSNPTPNSYHSRASFSSGTCSPKRTTVGAENPLATRAERRQGQVGVVRHRHFVVALGAAKIVQVAVHVQHLPRAGPRVQSVDVLRDRPDGVEVALHLGDHLVPPIGHPSPGGPLQLEEVVPGDLRPGRQHRPGQGLLDRQPVGGRQAGAIDAVATAVGGQPGVGREAGAGDEQQAAGGTQQVDDDVDSPLIGPR